MNWTIIGFIIMVKRDTIESSFLHEDGEVGLL